jgi:ribosomal protein S18 acetylase RimI-like enzyme
MMKEVLDRPIWHALAGRQAGFAVGDGLARRFRADVSPFIACADDSAEALAAVAPLLGAGETALFLQRGSVPLPPGTRAVEGGTGVQMVAEDYHPSDPPDGIVVLGEANAAEMLALATLTQPGPFRARTHELSQFWGVRDETGRLLAMAGERLKLPGMSEVSGVCTHPDARGRGYAALLSRHVASQIVRRGEVPFLHAYATNAGAIRLYEGLGFRIVSEVEALVVEPI